MAVYSSVISRHQVASVKIGDIPVFKLNLVLMIAFVTIVIMYVFMSNLLVSQRYTLVMRKSELNQLNAKLLTEKQYGTSQNLKTLLLFAQKSGLVEAKDIDSILENDGFAIFNQ